MGNIRGKLTLDYQSRFPTDPIQSAIQPVYKTPNSATYDPIPVSIPDRKKSFKIKTLIEPTVIRKSLHNLWQRAWPTLLANQSIMGQNWITFDKHSKSNRYRTFTLALNNIITKITKATTMVVHCTPWFVAREGWYSKPLCRRGRHDRAARFLRLRTRNGYFGGSPTHLKLEKDTRTSTIDNTFHHYCATKKIDPFSPKLIPQFSTSVPNMSRRQRRDSLPFRPFNRRYLPQPTNVDTTARRTRVAEWRCIKHSLCMGLNGIDEKALWLFLSRQSVSGGQLYGQVKTE